MKITVTQEHINKGEAKSGTKCPIALAITEAIGKHCSVGCHEAWIPDCGKKIQLPGIAQYFVICYDAQCESVFPFEFDIDYPVIVKLADMELKNLTLPKRRERFLVC